MSGAARRVRCEACRGWGFVFPPKGGDPAAMPDCPFCPPAPPLKETPT